jgi:phosphopantothenoylcysteine decarboxylase/phosphopantothenate--cysteine ligase
VHGLGDTLLASTLLATEAPVLAAAAMNTAMWGAPAVVANWQQLQCFERVLPLGPAEGLLACDRQGSGRMAEPELLLLALESLACWGWQRDWQGRRLLVSAGPTREWFDPARCISNPSTGRMGVLLAQAARLRGAEVDLVHGSLQLDPAWLEGLNLHPIDTGAQLQRALEHLQPQSDAIAMAAAVADHRPARTLSYKPIKAELDAAMAGPWDPVPDLLVELVSRRPMGQRILGFAAHSGDVLPQAQAKFARKGCDLLFANPIDQPNAGFGSSTNQGWLLGPGDAVERLELMGKLALAHRLITALGSGL